jgi:hypothetical protein
MGGGRLESGDNPQISSPAGTTGWQSYNTLVEHLIEEHGLIFDTNGFAFDFLGLDEIEHMHDLMHRESGHTHDTAASA